MRAARPQPATCGVLSGHTPRTIVTPMGDAEKKPDDRVLGRLQLDATPTWHTHCKGAQAGTWEDCSSRPQIPPRRFTSVQSSAKAAHATLSKDIVAASTMSGTGSAAEEPKSPVAPRSHSTHHCSAGEKLAHPGPARRPPSVVADAIHARARADAATKAAEAAAVEAEAKAYRVLELQGSATKDLSPEEAWQVVKAPREAKAAAVAAEVALTAAERLVADARAAELNALSQHANEHVRTFHGTRAVRALTSLSSFVKGERARVFADDLSRAEVCNLSQPHTKLPLSPFALRRRSVLAAYARGDIPLSPAHSPRPRA